MADLIEFQQQQIVALQKELETVNKIIVELLKIIKSDK